MPKRSTAKESLGWSDQEIENMLANGLVNQYLDEWLVAEHSALLKAWRRKAKALLAPLSATQLRAVAAAKLRNPKDSLLDIIKVIKEVKYEEVKL